MNVIGSFDIVIVGAGSAGSTLAGRLSQDPGVSVALIEAGPPADTWRIRTPSALVNLMRNPRFNWMFTSAPQLNLDGRSLAIPRGKTLGGSGAINSMVYIRGRASDYDAWSAAGCRGWDWDAVLPYFRKSENNLRITSELHGNAGPLIVSDLPSPHRICRNWIEAGQSVGIPFNADFNGATQEGLGTYQVTMQDGQRCSPADAFLASVRHRPNLRIFTGTQARTIEFSNSNASAIVVSDKRNVSRIGVRKQLVLSAGAIGTPALLMASGIGPAERLARLGIPFVNTLDGVGRNLQEHVSIGISAISAHGRGLSLLTLPEIAWSPIRYLVHRNGLLSTNHVEAGGFARTNPDLDEPDVQFHMIPARVGVANKGIIWGRGYFADACLLKPRSRGHIDLQRQNGEWAPRIDFNALADHDDQIRIVAAFRLLRSIMNSKPMQALEPVEDSPGTAVKTDAEIFEYCRKRLGTAYHPVGTCRMGPANDPQSVVDPELKLIGSHNVRVVDASIMPEIVAGNTNAPTIMIAEKAADLIRPCLT